MLNAANQQTGEGREQATQASKSHHRAVVSVGFLVSLAAVGLLLTNAGCKSTPASAAAPAEPNPVAIKADVAPVQAAEPAKASAETDAYSVTLKAPTSTKTGVANTLELSVTPKAPFHCNMEYPYKLKLEPNPVLSLSGDPMTKDAFQISADCTKLQIPFTATKAGTHVVTGQLSFSVCKDDQCLVERQALSVAVLAE